MSGGAAFPSPGVVIDERSYQRQQGAYEGMTLRDYFAAKAMQALVRGGTFQYEHEGKSFTRMPDYENTAMAALKYADAMLKAREA